MLAHWDEVESHSREKGPMGLTVLRLGDAAGAKGIGLNRVRVENGRLSTQPHSHGLSEEIFYVLGGSGLSWQDEGPGEPRTHEVDPGDCIVHVTIGELHTLRAGPDGLDVLAFGQRALGSGAWLARAGIAWVARRAVRIGVPRLPILAGIRITGSIPPVWGLSISD